ncbi:LysM domain-containing protein [Bradyrhizobium neotropicale]|uniref:LysM domain-containing protein n=1 Tax=Bradyrhizobium neotropicale TaxID=1497615 RepID=UPI001AD6F59F|nr:LysM domain-containing protein [Bradyrhizobium neotropicale]MBO4225578.1 LysM peptidoglycan-binding domain-containing protein [Bradyrhizobium neotropicale]
MINPKQVMAIVFRAMLVACIWPAGCHFALAAPAAKQANTAATVAALPPPAAEQPAPTPRVRAYLFRGAMGPIFSRGMDQLTSRLQEVGVEADVNEFTICRLIAAKAIREYKKDPLPIVLIGHSMGGLCSVIFAEVLQEENIPVSLIVAIDPAHATGKVPLNVERFINIFMSDSVLGGGDVVAESGYQGHYASFDLKDHKEVTHINIDKMDTIHDQLVNAVVQLGTTPMQIKGETAPLRYVVPQDAPLELWDSGVPQYARAGDTLQGLATVNHVPLWSLMQANQLSDNAPLTAGQRVVIPRHLMPVSQQPATTATAAEPAKRPASPTPRPSRGQASGEKSSPRPR